MERLLSVRETAQVLDLCLDSVRRQLRAGKLPGTRVGHTWRVPETQLKAHLGVGTPGVGTSHIELPPIELPLPPRQRPPASGASDSGLDSDAVEVLDALLRTTPARIHVLALARQAALSADLSPLSAQRLLDELNQALRRL